MRQISTKFYLDFYNATGVQAQDEGEDNGEDDNDEENDFWII